MNTLFAQQKPNILYVFIDDLGKEWVSAYGAEGVETPNIDNLAQTGILFNNFYSMPQCTPSRATLLTGQYPFRNGWVNHWDVPRWGGGVNFDSNKNPTIGKMLQKAGYKTAIAGKWQINDFRVEPEVLVAHGFDDYCMWTGYESGNAPSYERYWDPYIHTKSGSKTYEGKFGEDVFSDFLIDFMKKNKDDPMFLYYPMCLTHTPFISTPLEPNVTEKYDCHKAMVRYTDFIVGKLVAALEDLGIRDNTIIILTTDNGTTPLITGNLNGRSVIGGKQLTTENGICEPFIVNCPGLVPEGQISNALIDLTDMLPTFAELAGTKPSSEFVYDGKSFADIILGNEVSNERRKWIMAMGGGNFAKLSDKGLENKYVFRDRVIRNERFKLFISTDKKPTKLIDLINDPEEKVNLIHSSSADAIAALAELTNVMNSFPDKDNDPIYNATPSQDWDRKITVESQVWKN